MLFNSIQFIFFFPVVCILYFSLHDKYRWILLLASSYYFYMCWKPIYILLILFSTIIDYLIAINIYKSESQNRKRFLLYTSLLVNLGFLFSFKYLDFFSSNINSGFDFFNINISLPIYNLLLPVGISFYTFQTMSYTIDVYNEKIKPETHFGKFAVFVAFWPQLVAGPIERASNLLPQFHKKVQANYSNILSGLNKVLYGFFKKVVVADRLSIYVNQVFSDSEAYSTVPLIIASVFFAFQIYCDFSGYSDIAIGSARILGIDLMENFKRPYLAKSLKEFWQKWHISLSTWFRDYVYIPIGGNRAVKWRASYNILITFIISGLWHGANWTFIVWGAIHGAILIFENSINIKKYNLNKFTATASTFSIVCIAWIFFRANDISQSVQIIRDILSFNLPESTIELFALKGPLNFILSIFAILLLLVSYLLPIKFEFSIKQNIVYILTLLLLITILGVNGKAEFIYFQF